MIDSESYVLTLGASLRGHNSLHVFTNKELNDSNLIDSIMILYNLTYAFEARDMIAKEKMRRTQQTIWNDTKK